MEYIFKLPEEDQASCPSIQKTLGFLPFVISSLLVFAQNEEKEAYLEDETYENLVVAILETLVAVCAEAKFKDIMNTHMKPLAVEVALNFMVITRAEAEQIREDAEEYVNLTLDCCDKQTSMTIKSQACKLIEALCDNVYGAITFITTFCCSAINVALQKENGIVYD